MPIENQNPNVKDKYNIKNHGYNIIIRVHSCFNA